MQNYAMLYKGLEHPEFGICGGPGTQAYLETTVVNQLALIISFPFCG